MASTLMTNDDALRRALSLALPVSNLGASSANAALGVLMNSAGAATNLVWRSSAFALRATAQGADFVGRNVLAPAFCMVNPLAGWNEGEEEEEETHVGFVRTRGQAGKILYRKSPRSQAAAKKQLRRAHDSLRTGAATLAFASASTMQVTQSAALLQQLSTLEQSTAGKGLGAECSGGWSVSLGLQASML